MKYKAIYDVVYQSSVSEMIDRSPWRKPVMDLVDTFCPLMLIMESKKTNMRIWVEHRHGAYHITTACLSLDCKSKAYNDSVRYYEHKRQSEIAALLKKILNGEMPDKGAA